MSSPLSLSFRMEILTLTLLGWLTLYFFVNQRKVDSDHCLDFETELDRKTPYIPLFAPVYFSTYIFIIQPFFILTEVRQFYLMLVSFITISFLSTLIHAFVPSRIKRVEQVIAGGVSGSMLRLFQKTCKPYGNFPSMHVGLSVPVVFVNYMVSGPLFGSLMFAWAVLIAGSTLFTKQHYILDVLAGAVGGVVIFTLAFWLMVIR